MLSDILVCVIVKGLLHPSGSLLNLAEVAEGQSDCTVSSELESLLSSALISQTLNVSHLYFSPPGTSAM